MKEWISDEEIVRLFSEEGAWAGVARRLGVPTTTLKDYRDRRGIKVDPAPMTVEPKDVSGLAERARVLLKKPRSLEDLADALDVAPKVIRQVLGELRESGFRVPEEAGEVQLDKLAPRKDNLHTDLDLRLLSGEKLRLGVISDTHLCSNEQALEHLHLAYDKMVDEGVERVVHSGDWVDGRGIYRGHDSEVSVNTFERQVDYAVEHYPSRNGVETLGIGGNHDLEGEFGRIGADPVQAIANRRTDITYLGAFSAMVRLPNDAWLHLLHGAGGMSYAYSYKAQKLCEGYQLGRKPAILVPGHWHVQGSFQTRGVQVLFPGCFQWRSSYMERRALQPAVGFHIVDVRLGEDSSIVEYVPRWFPFWEGRLVADGEIAA